MKLREDIEPDFQIIKQKYPVILDLIKQWDDAYDNNEMEKLGYFVSEINKISEIQITDSDLFEYWEGDGAEVQAAKWSTPFPEKVEDITREELEEIVKRITNFRYYEKQLEQEHTDDKSQQEMHMFADTIAYEYFIPFIALNYQLNEVKIYQLLCCVNNVDGKEVKYTTEEYVDQILTMPKVKKKEKKKWEQRFLKT